MAEIKFKATRLKHDSGYRLLEKSGDLQYDFDSRSFDGIWLCAPDGHRLIMVDCKDGVFSLKFNGKDFKEFPRR